MPDGSVRGLQNPDHVQAQVTGGFGLFLFLDAGYEILRHTQKRFGGRKLGNMDIPCPVIHQYLLPLLVMLTGVAMLSRRVVTSPFTRTQAIAATLALATGQAVALHTQLRRYITGLDARNLNLDSGREWWWDIPVPAMAVWLIGTVCFAVLVWHLLRPGGILGQDEVRNVERELQARRGRAGRAPSRRPERVGA